MYPDAYLKFKTISVNFMEEVNVRKGTPCNSCIFKKIAMMTTLKIGVCRKPLENTFVEIIFITVL